MIRLRKRPANLPPVPRVQFLPCYRNDGLRPDHKPDVWHLVANHADRRTGRAGKARTSGYRPRTSPRMRHGIDSQPRASVVERRVRRAARLATAAGLPEMDAEQLRRLVEHTVARPGASHSGRAG